MHLHLALSMSISMDSLRRRLEESIWAKKKHCGPVVLLAPHHKHGDEGEGTIVVLLAPFAMPGIGS